MSKCECGNPMNSKHEVCLACYDKIVIEKKKILKELKKKI